MQHTVFDTPGIRDVLRFVSRFLLGIKGWRVVGPLPDHKKYVIIAAYHTSNWDFFIGICAAFLLRIQTYWIGKDTLFRPPFDRFFRWLGGIPINRSSSQNMVDRIIQIFEGHENMIIALAPEGTRKKKPYWKSGFYHIAVGARIPIVLAFIDYPSKSCGIGEVFYPTGDMEADMKEIRAFYSRFMGKFSELMTMPVLKPVKIRKAAEA
ncbi:MAG: lysophospholipid acyltransferase family protein [Deltaproteobacteria bacterium]|nr:lysophospholipid acyltransferase family protein [Deltaproteobacteria bacterium]